ncbi:hypothetical protein [Gordonia paraffinivorans]|uniref:hypothetical protein n=1 Tax=Gordonia paraffinivorans TaxID=175628 RepID=UPI0014461316|nr:hypothetical protein [Gordonia paraffinivorans]
MARPRIVRRRPRISLQVEPPRDHRTAVTVAGIGLTQQEAIELTNKIIDILEEEQP